ncbi:hypothetical protein (DUF239) [Arabidopsis thaliana]|uniref:Neprosin PEP catalytic domain-containing protein n=1 Tax=Arabidopsis thaliana TaxID=3702 RepID=F4IU76_ARATH|nr:hypothetical protein (DUF239) [Arabidopsis thaliana]AEC05766.1 hypothetical protein (DUF239) [Arabidopsis thaliana]|eukprot:NP_973414.1 hypothetical protein (DUF239) [Arabidopsis thaliana]
MGNKGSSCEHLGVSKITVPIWKYERINSTDESFASLIGDSPHEHAVGSTITSTKMYGANATISVWDPTVESRDEFSLSLIWITSGSYNKNNLNSIEAGWQVLPNLYQDSKPRLFIFWTFNNITSNSLLSLLITNEDNNNINLKYQYLLTKIKIQNIKFHKIEGI